MGFTFASGYYGYKEYCMFNGNKKDITKMDKCPLQIDGATSELMKLYAMGMTDFGFKGFP